MTDFDEQSRRSFISVAVSFGDREALARLGAGAAEVTCPACGARGTRYGDKRSDFRFEGFTPLTAGGLTSILCRCAACEKEVTLPHR